MESCLFRIQSDLPPSTLCAVTSVLTLCNPMGYIPPVSSVHGILQTGILEWVAMPFSRASSRPKDGTHMSYSSCLVGRFFTTSATCEEPPPLIALAICYRTLTLSRVQASTLLRLQVYLLVIFPLRASYFVLKMDCFKFLLLTEDDCLTMLC